ncbi:hypothetical protein Microterr_27170 [Microbacterium terricola]|uniref:Uncharacterized protein n=1 Tax=Microbacterium terricola TaxID=344163 RepID=A0ABM8E270_9MICO|nr:hypothetical protein Microterr_27170 [Microbacterium terricola]
MIATAMMIVSTQNRAPRPRDGSSGRVSAASVIVVSSRSREVAVPTVVGVTIDRGASGLTEPASVGRDFTLAG